MPPRKLDIATYNAKRDFAKTPEPAPAVATAGAGSGVFAKSRFAL